jgi:hypothetical protein
MKGDLLEQVRELSLTARLAVALVLFSEYCRLRSLQHAEIDAFVDYLWRFMTTHRRGELFNVWVEEEPALVSVGLGDEFEVELKEHIQSRGVSLAEFRQVVDCVTEVLYGSMYLAADEPRSFGDLVELAAIVKPLGVDWPDLKRFADSRWSDNHGWGKDLSPADVARWRYDHGE